MLTTSPFKFKCFAKASRKSLQMQDPAHDLREQDIAAVAAYFEQATRPATK
jgi:cytochrome c553